MRETAGESKVDAVMAERDMDELAVRLALAATRERAEGACPVAEDLAALAEGRLDGEERHRLLAHLARCEACLQNLLLVERVSGTAELLSEEAAAGRFHLKGDDVLDGLSLLRVKRVEQDVEKGGDPSPSLGLLVPLVHMDAPVQLQSAASRVARCPWCGSLGSLHGEAALPFRCQSCGNMLALAKNDT